MHVSSTIEAATLATAVIDRAELAKAFPIVLQAIEKRNTLPVLSCARLVADGHGARLVGTDTDMEISVRLPGAVDSRFDLCLDAHKFGELLKKAPASDMVAFTMPEVVKTRDRDGQELQTFGDVDAVADFERINFTLPAIPGGEFPMMTFDLSSGTRFEMPGAAFRDALDAVAGAISKEETRYYLNGVYMHVDHGGALVMVATDGHRLYRQRLDAPAGAEGMPGVIIPRGMVETLLKLTKGKACPPMVAVAVTESRVVVSFGEVDIRSKVIDGTFPDYNRVIPTRNDSRAMVDVKALADGVKGVSLISTERGRALKLTFSAGVVALYASSPGNGSAHMSVACSFDSDPMEIGFNAAYVLDMLATLGGDVVNVDLMECSAAARFTGEREGFDAVLMPMRV